ncbi:enoyl-CoA hydratase-related protein [Halospina sp. K52047b]|uniref:enoyl-CoA hydratase-related protein n=1 Tax=Halospina sp. K52047b TaxID=2614160 RepID=UPI00124AB3D9|nr:enoyl-CoA hydratase-related protein [Halospina sp. K52047b]KAA8983407.1 crotonase [Halospina sp. K52047b]
MIEVTREAGIVHMTIRRPEKKNALTPAMYNTLSATVDEAGADASVHALVITGCEGIFTAGNDIDDFRSRARADNPGPSAGLAFIERLIHCDTPVIAGVEGSAIGIGTTLLLHCDLVISGESAVYRTPFTDIGVTPEAASTVMGPLWMGFRRATQLLVLGEELGAEEAVNAGLVTHRVADGAAEARALAEARRLTTKSRDALRAGKQLMLAPWREQALAALDQEREAFAERLQSEEVRHRLGV